MIIVMEQIEEYDINTIPSSSYNLWVAKRRSGKSVLCEYIIYKMVEAGLVDLCFLFSATDAGFKIIKDKECRFLTIDKLHNLLDFYKKANEYNKIVSKSQKIKLRTVVVIDDMAIDLKSKSFNVLEDLSIRGRHYSYDPLSLHFHILSQSLTKIPRVCRLNADNIFMNTIPSQTELEMILNENFYILDSSRSGKNDGRALYHELVNKDDFVFIVIENYKQNCREYKDYIKWAIADISVLDLD
jgi:hypothetical protein